ncbi:hypothetical protein ASE21_08530 [Flavobacterium sp. Root901]|uniref:hypothetical protein n=1 Tax=Flavobacterium sp. Root901 TaxID=1736605 RepID=UPI00070B13D2|nr:hypothetical protein [Flavobacterium sp. Root901]KRD11734.1 hypothetical protein ASE21_08530 [Flavobacterium sp. Root901]
MNFKQIRISTITLSLLIFGISLSQNAVTINFGGKIRVVSSLEYFFMGSTALLGGGLLEQIIWMANPLCLFVIIYFIKNNKNAVLLSLIASCLAISFSFWEEILGAESGSMAEIVSLELGYYLWVLSILILTIGNIIYYKVLFKTTLES